MENFCRPFPSGAARLLTRAPGAAKAAALSESLVELCEDSCPAAARLPASPSRASPRPLRRLTTGPRIAFFEALVNVSDPTRRASSAALEPGARGLPPTTLRRSIAAPSRAVRNFFAGSISRPRHRRAGAHARAADDVLDRRADLTALDDDFVHLFSSWFNRGFLVLRRIDWSTPAIVLEKIIRYEAVHEIRDWDDLRRRIDPPDRRCYAFFHPALVDEPLIFVEVALTRDIPGAIAPLLERARIVEPTSATRRSSIRFPTASAGSAAFRSAIS